MENMDPMVVAPADGVVRGDSKGMPNKGTGTGFTGVGDVTRGASVEQGATNARGSAHMAPDGMDVDRPQGGGDYRSGGDGTPGTIGNGMGGAKSDAPADETSEDQRGL